MRCLFGVSGAHPRNLVSIVALAFLCGGCNGGGGGGSGGSGGGGSAGGSSGASQSLSGTISGPGGTVVFNTFDLIIPRAHAAFGGVSGATIQAFALDTKGNISGNALGSAVANASGYFTMQVPASVSFGSLSTVLVATSPLDPSKTYQAFVTQAKVDVGLDTNATVSAVKAAIASDAAATLSQVTPQSVDQLNSAAKSIVNSNNPADFASAYNAVIANAAFTNALETKTGTLPTAQDLVNFPPVLLPPMIQVNGATVQAADVKLGDTVTITAAANEPLGRALHFSFDVLRDCAVSSTQAWSTNNVFTYTFSADDISSCTRIVVKVRIGNGAAVVKWEIDFTGNFARVIANQVAVIGCGDASTATQADGKFLYGGTTNCYAVYGDNTAHMAVVRFKPNAVVDTSFGVNGVASYDCGMNCGTTAAAIQPDQKILVAGYSSGHASLAYAQMEAHIIRLLPNGSLDTSFPPIKLTGKGAVSKIAAQSNGGILVNVKGSTSHLYRYQSDGTPDLTFGQANGYSGSVPTFDGDFAIQSDQKIVIVGVTGTNNRRLIAVRRSADGTTDSTFGNNGLEVSPIFFSGQAHVVIQPADGKILAAGLFQAQNGAPIHYRMTRLNVDGTVDNTFGAAGVYVSPDYTGNYVQGVEAPNQLLVLPSGKILGLNGMKTMQWLANGSVDASYIVPTSATYGIANGVSMALAPGGSGLVNITTALAGGGRVYVIKP